MDDENAALARIRRQYNSPANNANNALARIRRQYGGNASGPTTQQPRKRPMETQPAMSRVSRARSNTANTSKTANTAQQSRAPVVQFTAGGRNVVVNSNNASNAPRTPPPACSKTLGPGGLRGQAFGACFNAHVDQMTRAAFRQSNASIGNASKMNSLCADKKISPHQATVSEIAKVMANTPDEKLGGHRGLLVWHGTGSGKCHAIHTPILMHDGRVKMVQDVQVGDTLMGDDSTPRTVLSLARGREDMYDIVPTKKSAETWGCNASHILVLKYIEHKHESLTRHKTMCVRYHDGTGGFRCKNFKTAEAAQEFVQSVPDDDAIVHIAVRDYIGLPSHIKHVLKMYKTGVEFEHQQAPCFDPYVLGVWLGDGTSTSTDLCMTEDALVDEVRQRLEPYGMVLTPKKMSGERAQMYSANSNPATSRGSGCNPFRNALREFDMMGQGTKHIPHHIKTGTRQTRLDVLAGIIDTDGYLDKNCYDIIQKNKQLADDIIFIARSLGFAAYVAECVKGCTYKGEYKTGTYHRISISGAGLEDIPVMLERKKAIARGQIKNALHYGFTVIPKGEGDYYGFELDGNHRYLLGDFTVTHNTLTSLAVILAYWSSGKQILVISSKSNINQAFASYKKLAPVFFPQQFHDISMAFKKDRGALHMTDTEAFAAALAEKVRGLSFREARNRLAAAPGEFTSLERQKKYKALNAGSGSVMIIDEAQGLAMKSRADPKGDAIKLGCALRRLSHHKLRKLHVFAMTATPGTTINQWLKLLSVVRRVDQLPFALDNDAGTNAQGRRLCEPSVGGKDDTAMLETILKAAAPGPAPTQLSAYVKNNLAGLIAYVDIRNDLSRHACVKEVDMHIPLDVAYYVALLKFNILARLKADQSTAEMAQHMFDPRVPDAYMRRMRVLGHTLPKTVWGTLPKEIIDGFRKHNRILKVSAHSEGRLLSPKFIKLAEYIGTKPGKQYCYTVPTNEVVLGIALHTWYGMSDVTNLSATPFGARYDDKTKRIVGLSPGNHMIILNDSTPQKQRERLVDMYNSDLNRNGEYIRVVIASGQLYEGLDLAGLRSVHLAEPMVTPLHEMQAIGRGVRNCSHRGLSLANRTVTILRWYTAAPTGGWPRLHSMISGMKGMTRGKVTPLSLEAEFNRIHQHTYDDAVFARSRRDPNFLTLQKWESVVKAFALDCGIMKRYHPGIACGRPMIPKGIVVSAGTSCRS